MDVGIICETVQTMVDKGLELYQPTTGNAYQYACGTFTNMFTNRSFPQTMWDRALEEYCRNEKSISAARFGEYLLSQFGRMKGVAGRNAKKLAEVTKRAFANKLELHKFTPENKEAMAVGKKHGLTEEQICKEASEGGQLLLIKAFIAEYRASKAKGLPFNYVMAVENGEVEWKEETQ